MKIFIKKIFIYFIRKFVYFAKKNNYLRTFLDIILLENSKNIKTINLKKSKIFFYETNSITKYRNDTFFEKEPETLDWINSFDQSSVFWDIGANVGLYSIYAAKTRNCNVNAFEPSVFNLELLAKNIYVNSLEKKISILPIVISDKQAIGAFTNSSVSNGAALSSLIQPSKLNTPLISECVYKMPVFTLDSICSTFRITKPKYLKIDVDGLEYNIINGAKEILKNLKSLLIEVDKTDNKQESNIFKLLDKNGFYIEKEGFFDSSQTTINQIWSKK